MLLCRNKSEITAKIESEGRGGALVTLGPEVAVGSAKCSACLETNMLDKSTLLVSIRKRTGIPQREGSPKGRP